MDEARADSGNDDALVRTDEGLQETPDAPQPEVKLTLVEALPGVAVVFGEVPENLEIISLEMMPIVDRDQFSTVLSTLGNAATIGGNISEAVSSAHGLFRVNEATLQLLKSGGEMAAKDGAKLGAILKNGKIVAQARFIPASITAATAVAAIAPAIAMLGLQMQLGEITGLINCDIQLTTQILKAVRNEQWAELDGLMGAVEGALDEACELGTVNESIWEPIAVHDTNISKQLSLYRKNVADHIQELRSLEGRKRRNYLEMNAEAIAFDTHALLRSLKMRAGYQLLRAARVRQRSGNDQDEAKLFKRITRETSDEINKSLSEIRSLVDSLVRELRIIAELPGRATLPLTKKHKDAKASRLTCKQVLEAIGPLADMLRPPVEKVAIPETVCAPEGLDLEPYLKIIRWFLEDGETLCCVAFPYEVGAHNFTGIIPGLLSRRVDATWDSLASGNVGALAETLAPSRFVALTNRRILTASPKCLLRQGQFGPIYSLDDVRLVRVLSSGVKDVPRSIKVSTGDSDLHWMFPSVAAHKDIVTIASVLSPTASDRGGNPTEIEAVSQQV